MIRYPASKRSVEVMTQDSPSTHKRTLFEAWINGHSRFNIPFAFRGEVFERRQVQSRIAALVERHSALEYVYVLSERHPDHDIPAYIGKARSPVSRWNQHLTGLTEGRGLYLRWRNRFLKTDNTVQFDLQLLVLGATEIRFPPIPDFPTTVGAVEYQLIGLAQDAYPLPLLNSEGQGR